MLKKKKRILIIEDEKDIRDIYALKFKKSGYDVVASEDGEVGLSLLTKDHRFDLLLLDVIMPKMDGFEFLRRIKSLAETKAIPVFILSNLGQEAEINLGLELKAEKYLIKSNYTPEEIVHKVDEFFNAQG